jgi:hypothetical protein
MKKKKNMLCLLFLSCFCLASIQAQNTLPATGGNASGNGGLASYTIGQIVFNTFSGSDGTIAQGVQQPYEISIVKENPGNTSFEITVYPNPTKVLITLVIKPFNNENLIFHLINIKGIILQDKKVDSERTEIQMEKFPSSVYFLQILLNDEIVEVFRIVKI